jgi:hypothetical protein
MIIDILLWIISLILGSVGSIIVFISGGWSIWPVEVLQGFTYFFQHLMNFNIIFPVDTLLHVISTMIKFDVAYVSVKLLLKLVNWARGAGGVELN